MIDAADIEIAVKVGAVIIASFAVCEIGDYILKYWRDRRK